jgi:hypothetical protein
MPDQRKGSKYDYIHFKVLQEKQQYLGLTKEINNGFLTIKQLFTSGLFGKKIKKTKTENL